MSILFKNDGILFQTLQPNDIEASANLLAHVFSNFEPICKALKIPQDDLLEFSLPLCEKAAEENLSIIAKNEKTGELVGLSISEDLKKSLPAEKLANFANKYEVIFAFLSELEEAYEKQHQIDVGHTLHIFNVAVSEKYFNRNIGRSLVSENLKLAKERDFKRAIAEATGAASQHVFRLLGFAEVAAIEYKSYEYKGEKAFQAIASPASCILMSHSL